ncbi:MAG TPA: GntR family transcriptional regulator [Solirubrobacterales bacterium]|nr:GntR family transcriptional regulator [Solirubrobacterales bacterium]
MSAVDDAYTYAKSRILDGRFVGGEMISEGDVAGPTGVSRTPVREAFLRLESEGLLRLYPKRGALIVPVSPAEVDAVMETRQLVELHGLEKAVERQRAVVPQLEAAIAEQKRLIKAGDASGFVEADREFHRVLVAATGNSILLDLHDSMRDRQTRMGLTAIAREEDRMDSILAEHQSIVDAIKDADADRADELLRAHLQRTLELLRGS